VPAVARLLLDVGVDFLLGGGLDGAAGGREGGREGRRGECASVYCCCFRFFVSAVGRFLLDVGVDFLLGGGLDGTGLDGTPGRRVGGEGGRDGWMDG